jgi:long-chain acyl-CoA synthetase
MHPSQWAERHPGHAAIVTAADGMVRDYAALESASNRGAHLLRRLGLGRGDRIALWCDTRPDYLEICWAAERAGLTFIPLSTRLTADEAGCIIADCDARLIVAGQTVANALRGLLASAAMRGRPTATVGWSMPGALEWHAETAALPELPIADQSGGRPMLYSSGTTGRPKGIVHAERPSDITAEHHYEPWLRAEFGLDETSIFASPAPVYHAAPLVFSLTAHRLGATVVTFERFDAEAFLAAVERYRISHAQLVPTMMIRLLRLAEAARQRHDLSSLRAVIHSGAPCPIAVKQAMINWLGPIVHEYYGGSEGFGRTCISAGEWLGRPGSVGRPRFGIVHVCDEAGHELPAGETGLVYFESDVTFAYHDDPQKTRDAAHPDHPRWRTFGDIGHVDPEGYLTLTDRKAFTIVSGGVNIYPQEIENLLVTHPAVTDVAVIGVPDEEMGEQVKAVVQAAPSASVGPDLAAALIAWSRERLAHYKCPRSIDFVETLPRLETGKIAKKALRDAFWTARH